MEFDINVIKSDVFKYLSRVKNKANVVFADPPYDFSDEKFAQIRQLVFDHKLLTDNGYLIIEHSTYTKLDHLSNFSFAKKYGGCMFSFFEYPQKKESE